MVYCYYSYGQGSVPYQAEIKGNHVTLQQFKALLSRKGHFKYFFKTTSDDLDIGVVFKEVSDDNSPLPLWKGKVFCVIEPVDDNSVCASEGLNSRDPSKMKYSKGYDTSEDGMCQRKQSSRSCPSIATENTPMRSTSTERTVVGCSYGRHSAPYQFEIPMKHITLEQFKFFLPKQGNFKYFFKTANDIMDTGVVFEEISDDSSVLPMWKGKLCCVIEPAICVSEGRNSPDPLRMKCSKGYEASKDGKCQRIQRSYPSGASEKTPVSLKLSEPTTISYSYGRHSMPSQFKVRKKHITLQQFKFCLPKQGNFKYFFKTTSDEMGTGTVFEEVSDDDSLLPMWEGKVFCVIEPMNDNSKM